MPRDGSNVYSQPFPDVVEDTTIESTVYNGFTNDVATDLNTARPIVAGGTGVTSADQALTNLGGEKSAQVVTNYDSMIWLPGSFYSAAGATAAPTANAFAGVIYQSDSSNIVLEARDQVTGVLYVRRKTAGVWGSWAGEVPTDYLKISGAQTTTGGFRFTSYLLTLTGTVTPNAYNGNYQVGNNVGAFTLAVPANECAIDLFVYNTATAGAITFSGYLVGSNTGDLLTTGNGQSFIISIRRFLNASTYVIKALQ